MNRILPLIMILFGTGCGEPQNPQPAVVRPRPARKPAPYLLYVVPAGTKEGVPFNLQPGGDSALAVIGKGFDRLAVITAGGRKLDTSYGNSGWLTTGLPNELYQKPGTVEIRVLNPDGRASNPVEFKVTAKDK